MKPRGWGSLICSGALDARGGKTSRGFIAVEPSEHRTRWFRARFQLGATRGDVLALYVAGANRGVRVYINQVEIGNTSLADAETFGWNYPLFFGVPSALLREGENTLDIPLTQSWKMPSPACGGGSGRGTPLI